MWTRVTMVLVPLGMAVSFVTSGGEMSVPDLLDKYEATQVGLRNFSTKSIDVSEDIAGKPSQPTGSVREYRLCPRPCPI